MVNAVTAGQAIQSLMFRVARIIDELDDVLGIIGAATSGAYVLIVFLSIILAVSATVTMGLRGLLGSLLIGGVAVSAATLSSLRD